MFDVYINNYPPSPPPPSHRKKNVSSSRQKKIVSSSRQKKIVSSCRCTHSKEVARATSSTDRNHSKKVVKAERATTDRCIEIIPYNKHRGSDYQKVQKKTGVGSKSAVTFQDSKAFQAMGTVVASHASQGLIKSVEYKEKTTKGGSIKRAMKVNYVKRDGGPSTSRSAPSVVPCSFVTTTTTSKKTSRSSVHIIDI